MRGYMEEVSLITDEAPLSRSTSAVTDVRDIEAAGATSAASAFPAEDVLSPPGNAETRPPTNPMDDARNREWIRSMKAKQAEEEAKRTAEQERRESQMSQEELDALRAAEENERKRAIRQQKVLKRQMAGFGSSRRGGSGRGRRGRATGARATTL